MTTAVTLPASLRDQGFALRAETEADLPFLRRLYVSTRWQELAPVVDWTDAQKVAFLDSQFAAQRHHYRTCYASTFWGVLERAGTPAGRLYLDRQATTLLIVDVSLLPDWRGRGIGTALLHAVAVEAHPAGRSVTISVEKFNPAQRLYRRLGFRETADDGMYWAMEWPAPVS